MADLIRLINDISTPVKLGWIGVLVWSAVQFMWYQRGQVLPGEAESSSDGWSVGTLFAFLKRSSDETDEPVAQTSLLSIAPAMEWPIRATPEIESHLGEAAEIAIENLLDDVTGGADSQEAPAALDQSTRRRRNTRAPSSSVADFALKSSETT